MDKFIFITEEDRQRRIAQMKILGKKEKSPSHRKAIATAMKKIRANHKLRTQQKEGSENDNNNRPSS